MAAAAAAAAGAGASLVEAAPSRPGGLLGFIASLAGASPALSRRRAKQLGLALAAVLVVSPRARALLSSVLNRILDIVSPRPGVVKNFLEAPPAADGPVLPPRAAGGGGAGASGEASWASGASKEGGGQAWKAKAVGEGAAAYESFSDFGGILPPWLAEGLRHGGFDAMRPIQRAVLPLALAGKDVVGIAPTGSGKTLAFLVPALVHVAGQPSPLRSSDGPAALVLAPTRELAVQIGSVAEGLMRPSQGGGGGGGGGWGYGGAGGGGGGGGASSRRRSEAFYSAVLYGGPRRTDQLQTLRFQQGTHLVIATPGRLLDFLRHGAFSLRRVSFFVLDEGDRMLDFGFEPDVTAISEQIRRDRQMLFFSATWPSEVEAAARKLCAGSQSFSRVSAKPNDGGSGQGSVDDAGEASGGRRLDLPGREGIALPPKEIRQLVEVIDAPSWDYDASFQRKLSLLLRYLEEALGASAGDDPGGKALIFVGTRRAAEDLGTTVARHFGLDRCGVMHGARRQDQREATLRAFRDGRLRALVATDVLGRGVDIDRVSHVVVFDFPGDIETYVHRVGRTGRNGRQGTSVAFFEAQPWYPDLPRELVEVLRACGQEVPDALEREASRQETGGGGRDYAWAPWPSSSADGGGGGGSGGGWEGNGGGSAGEASGATWGAPPLEERGSPPLADEAELGPWHAQGARVWSYSANGGESEQGRVELRAKGLLRTTWGWGHWALTPAEPHCPPPSRQPPPLAGDPHCPPPSRPCPGTAPADAAGEASPAAAAAAGKPSAAASSAWNLSLTWNGVTDLVALDPAAGGLGFDLVSRNGRPASSYRRRTLGRAMPGVESI